MIAPEEDADSSSNVTFAFGHAVGAGIQTYLTTKDSNKALFAALMAWTPDFLAEDIKRAKSIYLAVAAVERFIQLVERFNYLDNLELVYYQGRPATELSFIIHLPNGFTYKGYVDAVLCNIETGEVIVLEVKTSSSNNILAASYKNSAQAIGYSIVLDVIFPAISSYSVKYLIYKTKEKDYEQMDFDKSYLQRALWIRELLLDIDAISRFSEAGIFPMHGESCADFYRECEYFGVCTLSTESLITNLTDEQEAALIETHADFQISLTLNDLITAQLRKEV